MSGLFVRPASLDEALAVHQQHGGRLAVIAGGTDLLVGWNLAHAPMPGCMDISGLQELQSIEIGADTVTIGAGVSCARIAAHAGIAADFPMLVECARQTGSIAIQNRATLAGNIMNASPAADNPPALLAYGAKITLASVRGTRCVDYDRFHVGYKRTVAAADELLTAITLPRGAAGRVHFHCKVGTRRAQAISKVALAALIEWDGDRLQSSRFAFASMAPVPLLARSLSDRLAGSRRGELRRDAIDAALAVDLQPIDDIRSTALYRRRVAKNLVIAALDAR